MCLCLVQDMDLDEGQDTVDEDAFESEEKKTSGTRSRTHSRSRSRFDKQPVTDATRSLARLTVNQTAFLLLTAGPQRGGGQGHAQGPGSANTGNGRARAPENGRERNPLVPTPASDEHGRERRSGRRKAFLQSAPNFSAVRSRNMLTVV